MPEIATAEKVNPLAGLNKSQKLAALLVVLGPEEASVILSAFNQRQMEQIMGEMAKIEFLSAEVQQGLLEEFSSITLEAVTSAFGGVERAQNVLEKSLGQAKAKEVLGRVAPKATTSPMMEELRNMQPSAVAMMLRGEQSRTWALVLAQLEPENSAEILTFEASRELPAMVPRPPLPAVPTAGEPEAAVDWYSVEPKSTNPCSLLIVAIASCPTFCVWPFE